MNAYYTHILDLLGDADPILVLEATPKKLTLLLDAFSPDDWAQSYALGKWDARHIVAHLADVELGIGFRIRQLTAGAQPLQPFDQDLWAKPYSRLDPALAIGTFCALRDWNLARFATFDFEDWLKEAPHPELGSLSTDTIVRFLAGHDLNHLAQLENIPRAPAPSKHDF